MNMRQVRTRGESFAADIPPTLADADEVLTRFGRWAMHRHRKRHCGSAEGMYSIPPNDSSRDPKEVLMSAADAMAAQRALCRVAERERVVLQVLYVPDRLPVDVRMRMLRIPPALSRQRHLTGLRMFATLHARSASLDRYHADRAYNPSNGTQAVA